MSRQSGFIPIPFHIVGKFLIALGITGSLFTAVAKIGQWFEFSSLVVLFFIALIVVGLYLVFVVPREPLN